MPAPISYVRGASPPYRASMLCKARNGTGASRMRWISVWLAGVSLGAAASAAPPVRIAPEQSPIATSVAVPPGSRLVYISGQVPEVLKPEAPEGSPDRFGDTDKRLTEI